MNRYPKAMNICLFCLYDWKFEPNIFSFSCVNSDFNIYHQGVGTCWMYCTTTVFKKSIFLWITAEFTRVDPKKKVDHSLVNICYCVHFTVISSKFNYRHNLLYVIVFFSLSLFISGDCLSWRHCNNNAVRLKFYYFHIYEGWSQG